MRKNINLLKTRGLERIEDLNIYILDIQREYLEDPLNRSLHRKIHRFC